MAGQEGQAEGAHPRDGRPADPGRRRTRAAHRPGAGAARPRVGGVLAPASPIRKPTTSWAPSTTCSAIWPSGSPMDRLICGDVGFGKTEVAMRAAFVAAMSGVQVAVIAPTTLLARQHTTASPNGSGAFRCRCGQLSRFVSAQGRARHARRAGARHRRYRHRHPCAAGQGHPVSESRPADHRRGAAFRRRPTRNG